MNITLVAAISSNNCIAKNGQTPWNIPEDIARMREITRGKTIIMGRKTWESMPKNRQLVTDRKYIVITSDANYPLPKNAKRYATVSEALIKHPNEEIVSFGGERIFAEMITIADKLDITHVNQTVEKCDVFFPKIDLAVWKEMEREDHSGYSFVIYKRK